MSSQLKTNPRAWQRGFVRFNVYHLAFGVPGLVVAAADADLGRFPHGWLLWRRQGGGLYTVEP